MHFLDVVFPLQYPIFKPSGLDGGRGWLLALLLKSSAFYHAALTLSICHRRQMMPAGSSSALQAAALIQQETHLGNSIRLMNRSVHGNCGMDVPITIAHLMFFEVLALRCSNNANLLESSLATIQLHGRHTFEPC
jgi:C6 transcription factor Pro1